MPLPGTGEPTTLARARTLRIAEIDRNTRRLIAKGFEWGGKTFSLSPASQSTVTGQQIALLSNLLAFPVKWNTKDDTDTVELSDESQATAFFAAALGTVRAHLESGTALKDLVRAASSIEDVMGISDDRT